MLYFLDSLLFGFGLSVTLASLLEPFLLRRFPHRYPQLLTAGIALIRVTGWAYFLVGLLQPLALALDTGEWWEETTILDRMVGPDGWGYWLIPLTVLLLTQLFWIPNVRDSRLFRGLVAAMLLLLPAWFLLFVPGSMVPSYWLPRLLTMEGNFWATIFGDCLQLFIFVLTLGTLAWLLPRRGPRF